MIEYNKVFIDTSPFIYYLENNPSYVERLKTFFADCLKNKIVLVTSTITLEEYLVYPFKNNDNKMIENFLSFLSAVNIKIVNIDNRIAVNAARIRGKYDGIKGMDAIQISVCGIEDCDVFLTNDKQLKKVDEIEGKLVSEL